MKRNINKIGRSHGFRLAFAITVVGVAAAVLLNPFSRQNAAPALNTDPVAKLYERSAPDFDLNTTRNLPGIRVANAEQLAVIDALKTSSGAPAMTVRWNDFGGSPDVIYDFASRAYAGTPEEAARAFVSDNAALFGVTEMNNFRVFSQREALGGHLIRFQQTYNGVPVTDGGIGIVMNAQNQVIMTSGPFFRDVAVNTQPTINAAQAKAAADADLARFHVNLPSHITSLLETGLGLLSEQAAVVESIPATLSVYPTADGYKLAWKVAKFSTNPFGLYAVTIDAHTGEILARKDYVNFQTVPGQETADIYPKYPQIDDSLKDHGIISTCTTAGRQHPCGQERVTLRSFDPTNRVTGLNGTLTGTHALVNNALATKLPFGQAGLGTWHFSKDDPAALEARTNEQDQLAEPAEHQDEINAFFFVTYLLEYVDHLHIAGDPATFGSEGSFPDDYPNKTIPLPATVHIPNIYIALDAVDGKLPSPTDPDLVQKVLGLDNAFALNLTSLIEAITGAKSPVVVNPTSYGHGFFFNDLALEGTVPYHEGMHAITSPIAGLEGSEGGALNEGQADMWAFTITDNASLGDYVVNAKGYRDRLRSLGRDPDSVAYIRSARSTLKYSDYGTWGAGEEEEHYDGEIYMSTTWDIREMLNRVYPEATTYKRPQPKDGLPQKAITRGTNIFERDFLGSMYILGTMSPDTMVKARDAMIVADQMLYPSNATDPDSPGKHRAMIEQIFAAKELGINAGEFSGGKVTISTQVSHFAGGQSAPSVPKKVKVAPASPKSLRISWDAVSGSTAYEVLKRKINLAGQREPNGKREFNDGDASTSGYRHVAFVSGNQTSFEDKGPIHEVFAPRGLTDLFDSEYVVRAIGVNSTGQMGWSKLSGSSRALQQRQDLTNQVDSAISNISFSNGVMAFDNKLTNARGAFSTDKTIYKPIEFQIVSISNPSVTVRNADANGDTFIYNETLALGQASSAKRLEFNDPLAQLFSFDAKVYGNAYSGTKVGNGSQSSDGSSDPPEPIVYAIFTETFSGALVAGEPALEPDASVTWGDPLFKGITWDDIPVTTKSDALSIEGFLSASTAIDLDFELRTTDGQVLMRSATASANEYVSAAVQPNTTYIFRVLGWANGPTTYQVVSNQFLPEGSPNANGGTTSAGGDSILSSTTTTVSGLFRFTVNPLTKKITFVKLQ